MMRENGCETADYQGPFQTKGCRHIDRGGAHSPLPCIQKSLPVLSFRLRAPLRKLPNGRAFRANYLFETFTGNGLRARCLHSHPGFSPLSKNNVYEKDLVRSGGSDGYNRGNGAGNSSHCAAYDYASNNPTANHTTHNYVACYVTNHIANNAAGDDLSCDNSTRNNVANHPTDDNVAGNAAYRYNQRHNNHQRHIGPDANRDQRTP